MKIDYSEHQVEERLSQPMYDSVVLHSIDAFYAYRFTFPMSKERHRCQDKSFIVSGFRVQFWPQYQYAFIAGGIFKFMINGILYFDYPLSGICNPYYNYKLEDRIALMPHNDFDVITSFSNLPEEASGVKMTVYIDGFLFRKLSPEQVSSFRIK